MCRYGMGTWVVGMERGGSAGGVDEKGWGHPVIRTGTLRMELRQ